MTRKPVYITVLIALLAAPVMSQSAPDGGRPPAGEKPEQQRENEEYLHGDYPGPMNDLFAQSNAFDSADDRFRNMRQLRRERAMAMDEDRQKHLEQFRTLKLLELLDLKEDQEVEFLTSFRKIRDTHKDLDDEKREMLGSLSEDLAAGKVDKHRLELALESYFQIEKRRQDAQMHFIDKIKSILTPEQTAKFILFEERFERELLEQVKAFHDRRQGGRP